MSGTPKRVRDNEKGGPWFSFFPGDYLADTMELSCCEHGVYVLLLCHSWKRGPLPDDLDRIQRMAASATPETIRFILENYWTRTEAGWVNIRLEKEREYALQKSRKARQSAMARWGNKDANALPTDSDRNANADANAMLEPMLGACYPDPDPDPDLDLDNLSADYAAEGDKDVAPSDGQPGKKCPHQKIIDTYHEQLPDNPKVRVSDARRQGLARSLWKQHPDLNWFRDYFAFCAESKFLTGKTSPKGDRPPFVADLEWILKPANFAKIYEGKYHRG